MKRKCAWCDKDLGEKPPYTDQSVTHTICDTCRETERQTGQFELAIKNNPKRYLAVRDSQGQLIEVQDLETGSIHQKSRTGWYVFS